MLGAGVRAGVCVCVSVCVLRTPALRKVCGASATIEEGKSASPWQDHTQRCEGPLNSPWRQESQSTVCQGGSSKLSAWQCVRSHL